MYFLCKDYYFSAFQIVLLYLSITLCNAMSLLEFFLGPSIGRSSVKSKSLDINPAQILVEQYGYAFESHEVVSDSGYILNLHRVNRGKSKKKPVALFQHGIFSASDTWLFRGPKHDLPYVLADAGYDVWLSNMRGNIYSKHHKSLNADKDARYWEFSLHEIAIDDYPAIVDYILNHTQQEDLYFLGHSIGSTVGFIFCSLKPEYNQKIKLHLALAPLVYANHSLTLGHRMLFMPGIPIMETAISHQIYNIFPRRHEFTRMLELLCANEAPLQNVCLSLVMATVGTDYNQLNTSYIPDFVTYFPAGCSAYVIQHTLQMYLTGNFGPYRYGNNILKLLRYNSVPDDSYNLTLVTHPISLYYGGGDILVTEEDLKETEKRLPNSKGTFQVPFENFNHMDFIWGTDNKKLLFDELVKTMDKYR